MLIDSEDQKFMAVWLVAFIRLRSVEALKFCVF